MVFFILFFFFGHGTRDRRTEAPLATCYRQPPMLRRLRIKSVMTPLVGAARSQKPEARSRNSPTSYVPCQEIIQFKLNTYLLIVPSFGFFNRQSEKDSLRSESYRPAGALLVELFFFAKLNKSGDANLLAEQQLLHKHLPRHILNLSTAEVIASGE